MHMVRGKKEKGVVVGNTYDKYGSSNPVYRMLIRRFDSAMTELVTRTGIDQIHEVGCGEGYWTIKWAKQGKVIRGSDFSETAIELARENAQQCGVEIPFKAASIYDLCLEEDSAPLIICAEVLEHLDEPERALECLIQLKARYYLFSVPNEPLWSLLNLARLSYISTLGNTPGHVNRWSRTRFTRMLAKYFHIDEVRMPVPWVMVLGHSR